MAVVFQSRHASRTVYIDVVGSVEDGYRITRQVLDEDSEHETIWDLPPDRSRVLRLALGDTANDDLSPTGSPDTYEAYLLVALEGLEPGVTPFQWLSRD